jgi:hypothetical protein
VWLAGLAAGQYAGSSTCKPCHAAQFASHAQSGHARALQAAPADVKAEWAFGSGLQAVTYVSRLDDEFYLEHGLSLYTATGKLDLTPGHRDSSGERYRTFDPGAAILRCFQCHSTGPLRLGAGFRIEPFEPGVQCEACHGTGEEHARAQRAIRNPKRLSAVELNDFCGACHRKPAATGDDTDWTNPWNARHQPLYLAESACFKKSSGALSCLTCHPAHTRVARAAAEYDARCASCHPAVKHRTAVDGRSCSRCHMPVVAPSPYLSFANHWIGVYENGNPLRPTAARR